MKLVHINSYHLFIKVKERNDGVCIGAFLSVQKSYLGDIICAFPVPFVGLASFLW